MLSSLYLNVDELRANILQNTRIDMVYGQSGAS